MRPGYRSPSGIRYFAPASAVEGAMGKGYLAGALVLALVLAACAPGGTSIPAGGGDGAAPATEKPAAAPGGAAPALGPATTVKVTVTGGPRAGSYSGSSRETICSLGILNKGQWGVQYSDANMQAAKPEAFTSFQFLGAKDEADGVRDSEDFFALVNFGPLIGEGSIAYTIKPADERSGGRGTATVEVRGATAAVTVKGETKEGVKIDARVDCHAVLRF